MRDMLTMLKLRLWNAHPSQLRDVANDLYAALESRCVAYEDLANKYIETAGALTNALAGMGVNAMSNTAYITRVRDVDMPTYATAGSVGLDLQAACRTEVPPKSCAMIPTGLVIVPPEGCYTQLYARSSLLRKRGLMLGNGVGVVDRDYCGIEDEIWLCVLNTFDINVTIEKGERIAQAVFAPAIRADIVESEHEALKPDGRGGFGSTGGYAR